MPVVTICPDCSRKLRVPDELLGKKVRCPGCKVVFTAASEPEQASPPPAPPPPRSAPARDERIEEQPRLRRAPSPEERDDEPRGEREQDDSIHDEEDDLPRGRRLHEDDEYGEEEGAGSQGNRAAWRKVGNGITFVLVALGLTVALPCCGALGGGIIGGVTAANAPAGRGQAGPGAVTMAASSGGAFFALAVVLNLLAAGVKGVDVYGHYLGTAVPDKPGTGLRGLALTTLGLIGAAAGLTILSNFLSLALGMGGGLFVNPLTGGASAILVGGFGFIGGLCQLAGMIVFVLYLRAVAFAVKRKDLGKLLRVFLISVISAVAVGIVVATIAVAVVGTAAFAGLGRGGQPGAGAANAMAGGFIAMAVLGCIGFLVGLGLAIWYIILLVQLRAAVMSFARRA
jgi:hypothetical protein